MSLRDLIGAVEAGTLPDGVFHGSSVIRGHWAYTTGLNAEQRKWVYLAYNGSLDAAKALHDALLPGWVVVSMCQLWDIGPGGEYIGVGNDWLVELQQDCGDELHGSESATEPDPARAWLLAILRAMGAEGR